MVVNDVVKELREYPGECGERAADLIERLWQLNVDACETDTNCRKLLAKYDTSDSYGVVPLEDLIACLIRELATLKSPFTRRRERDKRVVELKEYASKLLAENNKLRQQF